MKRQFSAISIALFVAFLATTQAEAQRPPLMFIRGPSVGASLQHDGTDGDQVFGPQRWWVLTTGQNGATVTFATEQAFTHIEDDACKRDARLDLAIGAGSRFARWRVNVASDRTNYVASNETAIVQATSRRDGWARFDLTVTFITDEADTLAQGDYTLTVTGTLTAN
jgi:hypothetical protein